MRKVKLSRVLLSLGIFKGGKEELSRLSNAVKRSTYIHCILQYYYQNSIFIKIAHVFRIREFKELQFLLQLCTHDISFCDIICLIRMTNMYFTRNKFRHRAYNAIIYYSCLYIFHCEVRLIYIIDEPTSQFIAYLAPT